MHKKKIIIVGKGGSGKDFLKKKFVEKGFISATSHTTRPPRENEIHGVDYYFINSDIFVQAITNGMFIEHAKFNDWYYGSTYDDWLVSDVFIKTPAGVLTLKEKLKDCFVIYLDIPLDIRYERLRQRNDADNVDRRITNDEHTFKDFKLYDIRVTNHDF